MLTSTVIRVVLFVGILFVISRIPFRVIKWAVGIGLALSVVLIVYFSLVIGTPGYYLKTPIPRGAKIIENFDDHGGFHGDGTTWILIQLNDEQQQELISSIQDRPGWAKLPLPDELMKERGMMRYDDDRKLPVDLVRGYYYFHDSQSDWDYPNDRDANKPLYERASSNFIVGMLDVDKRLLYIFKVDT